MSIKEIKNEQLTWVHINKVDSESIEYLKKKYRFHPLDLEDVQTEHPNPKLDVYKNYILLILQFPFLKISTGKIISHEIDIFIGDGYVITIQDSKHREIKDLFYRCVNNRSLRNEWMSGSSGFLLYKILEDLFSGIQVTLNEVGKQLGEIENEVYKEELQTVHEIKQLAMLRRNIFSVRRIIDPQRFVISTLSHTRRSFLDESLSIYFDDIRDLLDRYWVIVESYNETSDGLHWTIESMINQRTTKIISALTVVSVAFTPLVILTGFYGMNLSPLPFQDSPETVYILLGALTFVIILVIYILKRKRWL